MSKLIAKWRSGVAGVMTFCLTLMVTPAFAGGTYDSITTAVDWSEVITGIVAIAALVAAVLVVKRGVGMLLRVIGR